jgi:hypothetical protein
VNYNIFIENSRKIQSVTCGHCEKVFSFSDENIDIEVITLKEDDNIKVLTYNFLTEKLYNHEYQKYSDLKIETYKAQKKNTIERCEKTNSIITITQKTSDGSIIEKNPCKKINTIWYCSECIQELFIKCDNCDNYFDKNDVTEIDGENFCEICKDDIFYFCENCDEYFKQDDAINAGDFIVCSERCANEKGFYKCVDCNTWYNGENEGGVNSDGNNICEDCQSNYCSCENCGDVIHTDNARYSDRQEGYYCENCYDENNLIHDYSYMPELNFNKMKWENTLYLGLEFEFETENDDIDTIAENINTWLKKHKKENAVYLKKDSSLENGIEIVFHPFTLQALHKNFPLKSFIDFLKTEGLKGYNSGRCGFHIHVSKNHFRYNGINKTFLGPESDTHKLKLFFYKCKKYLKIFSKRKDFHYCSFPEEYPHNGENQNGRYEAVNTATGKETIEFRLFRGTSGFQRIIASIQFVDAISYYIVNTSYNTIKELNHAELWQAFLSYCKKENRYGHFIKYIFIKKII